MPLTLIRILFLIVELFLLLGVVGYSFYTLSLIIAFWYDIPYVSTSNKSIKQILSAIPLDKHTFFIELGCGDGRVLCSAAKQYGVHGSGVDLSIFWVLMANVRARYLKVNTRVHFKRQNILKTDISKADVLYLFGISRFIESDSFRKKIGEAKPGSTLISHGFSISYLANKQILHIPTKKFETYVYRL
jgi:hypothetical protein